MQDRFRFRVWNKKNKEMIYNAEIAYDGMNYNTSWQIGKNTNDGWVDCFGYYLDYPEDYEVMQCTGLKDKNGKLIYEGDIVKNNQNSLYSVEFEEFEHQTKFCLKRVENPDYYPHISTWQGIGYKDQKNYEVIGNIYENPELLEE